MAIVNLLDWDLTRWQQPTVFSLDLMKLAYYHKIYENNIVQMLPRFTTEGAKQVIIFKDYEDDLYPKHIVSNEKVSYRGLAISGGEYSPLNPEIEKCPADTSIYEDMKRYYNQTLETSSIFSMMMSATHLRLSLNNETLFEDWEQQLVNKRAHKINRFIIHDKELTNVKDALDTIQYLIYVYGTKSVKFGFKFPLKIDTEENLINWNIPKVFELNKTYLMKFFSDEIFVEIAEKKQQLIYYIDEPYWTLSHFLDVLPQIYLQGIYLSKRSIPLLLKIGQNFSLEKQWQEFITFFNHLMRDRVVNRALLGYCGFTYCKTCYLELQREEKIKLFSFIKKVSPALFDFLYNAEEVELVNGSFVPKFYSWKEIERGGGYGGYHYRKEYREKLDTLYSQEGYDSLTSSIYIE